MPSIFVTGAGKGIGRAVVERLAADGWETLGITRSHADVAALNNLPGGRARFRAADAADAAAVAAVVAEVVGDGGLDLLVNNAGGFRYGGFREATAADLEAMWRANVLSAFTVTRALLPALERAGGRIANIVSVAALKPLPGKAAYCASKAAEAALFRCLREEIAAEGVTVTNIHPGVTFTSSFDREPVDPATMMAAAEVAEAAFRALTIPGNLVAEELVLQPAAGIRL
jgi:NAD(P)-dependent dehydrogenase (short-subunit alcohol dehydrogenase family)